MSLSQIHEVNVGIHRESIVRNSIGNRDGIGIRRCCRLAEATAWGAAQESTTALARAVVPPPLAPVTWSDERRIHGSCQRYPNRHPDSAGSWWPLGSIVLRMVV